MVISDPNDGDGTYPMFWVRVPAHTIRVSAQTVFLHGVEFAPAADAEAYRWARRQLKNL